MTNPEQEIRSIGKGADAVFYPSYPSGLLQRISKPSSIVQSQEKEM
jgi:hypothetical protein